MYSKRPIFWDVLFGLTFLGMLVLGIFALRYVISKEPPPPCNCKADVDATAQNCVDAYAEYSTEFEQHMQLLFNALEACIWVEEEGYAAVEDTPPGDRAAWRKAMNRVDEAEIYKDSVWKTYHDFYGEADLWDL